jgi:RNA polymerase sigma-70 factor (ECF subfamily)
VNDPAPNLRIAGTAADARAGGSARGSGHGSGQGPDAADVFAILVREQSERLLAYLRASVPASSVDDIFQETVLVAWRRLGDYDRSRPFGAWMRGIARNMVLDFWSRAGRERPTDDALLDGIDRRAAEHDRADREEFRAQLARLDECVAALPDEYRTVIHHCYRLDAPVARIAAEVGANVEAVKKRLQRARAMIAACMERKGATA